MSDFDSEHSDSGIDLNKIGRERRIRILVLVAVLSVIIVVPVALFGTTAFHVKIGPDRAQSNAKLVAQEGLTIVVGNRVILFGQSATLSADAPGFHPTQVQIDRNQETRVLQLSLAPQPGQVTFKVHAESEVVLKVNNEEVEGEEPITVELQSGRYIAEVTGREIVPLNLEFDVIGFGEKQEISLVTELSRSTLTLQTQPATASIEINGELVGQGNFSNRVSIGELRIRVSETNYFIYEDTVVVALDEALDLGTVTLRPKPATVTINSTPSDASILIKGDFVGSTPTSITVEPNENIEISLRKSNFETHTENLRFDPGEVTQKTFNLSPISIQVVVDSNPQAIVWLNESKIGNSPITFDAVANDVVKVSKDGFAPQRFTIEAADHPHKRLNVVLIDELQDRFNKAPVQTTVKNSIVLQKMPPLEFQVSLEPDVSGLSDDANREIELTRAYYLGVHEIRLKEYALFSSSRTVSKGDEELPVSDISWIDAARFCNWLSAEEGLDPVYEFLSDGTVKIDSAALGYRLPTEAEWEAASQYNTAKENVIGVFPWGDGDAPSSGSGNFSGRESRQDLHPFLENHLDNHVGLAPVGSYRRNPNGFFDLAGNVSEWVQDYYESAASGYNERLVDPLGPASGMDRMVKGANFRSHDLSEVQINSRRIVGFKDETVGFRVARWLW